MLIRVTMDMEELIAVWRKGGVARRRLVNQLVAAGALEWADRLVLGPPEAHRLAALLLGEATSQLGEAADRLRCLAQDPDLRTREEAAQAMGKLLVQRFSETYPLLGVWRRDPDPRVRRAVVLVAAVGAEPGRLDWAEPLLGLLEPLLSDKAKEVRGILGPRVLAHSLLSAYPDDTFEHLVHWSTSHNDQVLWNVAMALSGPEAAKQVRKAFIILRRLSLDDRRYVRGAVVASLRRLLGTCKEEVLVEVQGWLSDEERAPVAQAVLRHP